jgi:hypothetical protein
MNGMLRTLRISIFVVCVSSYAHAQGTGTPSPSGSTSGASAVPAADCLTGTVKSIEEQFAQQKDQAEAKKRIKGVLERWPVYICQFTADAIRPKLLTQAETERQDKQPGATSSSSGSTSLVSKGSSPSLLGFALEHGGLTQTTNGNTITFRGNAANSITALLDSTYLGSYKLSQSDPLVRYLAKVSFGVSFDAATNKPSTTQGFEPSGGSFSGLSVKYEIYNHRDPRDARYIQDWNRLAGEQGVALAGTIANLDVVITQTYATIFDQWSKQVFAAVDALPSDAPESKIREVVDGAAESFHSLFWDLPKIKDAVASVTSSMSSFLKRQDTTLSEIRSTPIATVEYNLTRQLTSNSQTIIATQPNQKIPDLSNVNLVVEKGFVNPDAPELTLNLGGTWFNSPNTADPTRGRIRDIRASLEADWQLAALKQLDKPTLSLAGQYLNLIAEPLGQQVMLNGVTIVRRGPMEVFQAKLTIPAGGSSGVKIPLSFTWASRTELVKESDVRGNLGVTFDLDTLFSTKTK